MKEYQLNLTFREIDIILNALRNDEQRHQSFLNDVVAEIMKAVNFDHSKFEENKMDNKFYVGAIENIEAHKSAKMKMFELHDKHWNKENEN